MCSLAVGAGSVLAARQGMRAHVFIDFGPIFSYFQILARAWPGLTQGLCHVLYLAAAWEGGLRGTAFVHSALLSPTLRGATLPALMHAVDVPPLGCPIRARVNRSGVQL